MIIIMHALWSLAQLLTCSSFTNYLVQPSVEAGMSLSRLLMNNKIFGKVSRVFGTLEDMELSEMQRVNRKVARDRLLLACGAAAGVSAGFNAPLSGVFFALEIVQNSLVPIDFPLKQAANTNSNI